MFHISRKLELKLKSSAKFFVNTSQSEVVVDPTFSDYEL